MEPPEEVRAVVKPKQCTPQAQSIGRRKFCSLLYNYGSDNHYQTEKLQMEAGLKIQHKSTKRILVADGHVKKGEQYIELPLKELSARDRTGDVFQLFRESLMSVGKVKQVYQHLLLRL